VLIQAHVARARLLVIATPDGPRARRMIEVAQTLRPELPVVVRAHSDEETALLAALPGVSAFMGEHELAMGMTRCVEERLDADTRGRARDAVA
jgi:CPA2 family monovalent cation:H+ antiporter-2